MAQQTSCYCLQTRQAASSIKDYYDRALAPSKVTARQYSLLLNISKLGQCSVRELADATSLDRSTLARSIKPLLQDGHVVDTKDSKARNSQLCLTPKGQQTMAYAAKLWAEAQRSIEEKFGPEGMAHLKAALALLNSL